MHSTRQCNHLPSMLPVHAQGLATSSHDSNNTHTQWNAPAVQYAMMVRMTLSKSRSFARKLCMPASPASSTTHAYTQQHPAGLVVPSHRPVPHHHTASTARYAKAAPAALTALCSSPRRPRLDCQPATPHKHAPLPARRRCLSTPAPLDPLPPPSRQGQRHHNSPTGRHLPPPSSEHPGHHYCELPVPPAGQPPPPCRRLQKGLRCPPQRRAPPQPPPSLSRAPRCRHHKPPLPQPAAAHRSPSLDHLRPR
jgi:hypothetical protein